MLFGIRKKGYASSKGQRNYFWINFSRKGDDSEESLGCFCYIREYFLFISIKFFLLKGKKEYIVSV